MSTTVGKTASLQLTGLSFLAMRRRQLQADESNAERSCTLILAAFDLTKNKTVSRRSLENSIRCLEKPNATSYTKSAVRCQRFSPQTLAQAEISYTGPRYKIMPDHTLPFSGN